MVAANSMIVESRSSSTVDDDLDVVIMTHRGPIRIPCLRTQWNVPQRADIEDSVGITSSSGDEAMQKHLESLSAQNSVFQRLFGISEFRSNPMDKREYEEQREATRQRLDTLMPSTDSRSNVVEEMFSGAAHTLPAVDDMFTQFMAYFVEPQVVGTEADDNDQDGDAKKMGNALNDIGRGIDDLNMDSSIVAVTVTAKQDALTKDVRDGNVGAVEEMNNDDDCKMTDDEWKQLRFIVEKDSRKGMAKRNQRNGLHLTNGLRTKSVLDSFWSLRDSTIPTR